jgi:GTP-binding protein Era
MPSVHSGFVAIIGRPNVGKSSFLNYVLAEKLSIISPKAQTTRNRILGILNTPDSQIVFLDTPGIHTPHKELNRAMVEKALACLNDADLVLVMADATQSLTEFDIILEYLHQAGKPAILALNKVDLIPKHAIELKLNEYLQAYPFVHGIAISCATGEGVDSLMSLIAARLPEGPRFFPEDQITDLSERFLAAEIIREKVFNLTQQEIPYAVAVEIEQFKEGDPTYINAVIHVERPGQKAIVIGKKGGMLKEIGTQARFDIQRLIGTKVFLELFVRVTKDWTKNPHELKRLGYS